MKVAVVHGGYSSEKEVSTQNAAYIAEILTRLNYEVCLQEYSKDLISLLKQKKIDIVYICVQGKGHGDGTIQAMLDHEEIPYTGSNMQAAALINDKILCKLMFEYHKIETPPWKILTYEDYKNQSYDYEEIGFPFVAKAPSQGGSFGIELIHNYDELEKMEQVFIYDQTILLEKFIKGKYYTVGLIERQEGLEVLELVEVISSANLHSEGLFSASAGYYYVEPVVCEDALRKKIIEDARYIFQMVGAQDVARIDYMFSKEEQKAYVIEINAVPGLKEKSLLPKEALLSGISNEELIEGILLSAWNRHLDMKRGV